jgi:hypothetical protein
VSGLSRSRSLLGALLSGAAAVLVLAPSAGAAAQIGSECQANLGSASRTSLQKSLAAGQVATSAPGVVTKWTVVSGNIATLPGAKLRVFKPVGAEYELVAESSPGSIVKESRNEFSTRIPVAAGLLFGVYSPGGSPICFNTGAPGDVQLTFSNEKEFTIGSKQGTVGTSEKTSVAVMVKVEADSDGDGFGDETQDGCPQLAAAQTACPVTGPAVSTLKLGLKARLEGNVIAVRVTGNENATIAVSDKFRGRVVAGPKRTAVEPGQTGRVYLPLSKSVKEQLAKLPRKRHLNLLIEASGRAASGATGRASLEVAVPGRKKPQKRQPRGRD